MYMDFLAAIPIITGLVQSLKMAGFPTRFSPIVAIILGVLYSGFANNVFNFMTVMVGITYGLASVGLYEAGKQTVQEVKKVV